MIQGRAWQAGGRLTGLPPPLPPRGAGRLVPFPLSTSSGTAWSRTKGTRFVLDHGGRSPLEGWVVLLGAPSDRSNTKVSWRIQDIGILKFAKVEHFIMGRPFFSVFRYRSILILKFRFPFEIPPFALAGYLHSLDPEFREGS